MGNSIHATTKKRRGRPVTTGKGTLIGVRLLDAPLATLDAWISRQKEPDLTRPEAIRQLVDLGLTLRTKAEPSKGLSAACADRAKELAAKAIEKIIEPGVPSEEHTERKRRLTKGPAEFRDARVDQPKAKGK